MPAFALGHPGSALRNAHGLEISYDGYDDPYFHAVALFNLFIGYAGLLVLDPFFVKRQVEGPESSRDFAVLGLKSLRRVAAQRTQGLVTHAFTKARRHLLGLSRLYASDQPR